MGMNKYHAGILEEIKKAARPVRDSHFNLQSYMGTKKPVFNIPNAKARTIAKTWVKNHSDISLDEFIKVLNSFYFGKSHNERTFGGFLLEYFPGMRKQLDPGYLDKWLTGAQGWLEVDSLCQ